MDNLVKSKKDYQILASIIEDSRIPLTKLAKKTRLSREVVQYRLKNLEKSIIINYEARINLSCFSTSIYTIYLNISGVERGEAVKKLKSLAGIHWIGNSAGRWNFIITFSVSNKNSLSQFLEQLSNIFENKFFQYTLLQHLNEYKDTFGGLFGRKENIISEKRNNENIELDELDREIIKELTINCRISNAEIAEKLKVTRETIRTRIKFLENKEIILNYRTIIRPQALNLENYMVMIKCKPDSKSTSELSSFLTSCSQCSYVCTTAGEFQIITDISFLSIKEMDSFISNLNKRFPELIQGIEPLPLFELGVQTYSIKS